MAAACHLYGMRVALDLPAEVIGPPFGLWLHEVATYLKTLQVSAYERLEAALTELFGLQIRKGGLIPEPLSTPPSDSTASKGSRPSSKSSPSSLYPK